MKTHTQPEGLPASIHMECTILGSMLLDPVAVADATGALEASDFSLDGHQRIFRAILSLHVDGEHVDSSTVRERLLQRRELDTVGGFAYVLHLEDGIPRNFNVESYARTIKEKSLLRQLAHLFGNSASLAADPGEDGRELIDQTISRLQEFRDSDQSNDILSVGEYLAAQGEPEQMFERLATPNGIKFGFTQWDELTGGAQPGELHIFAGRPSMGKTALMCNMAHYAAVHDGKHVALFSMEQPQSQIIRRMLAAAAQVDARKIKAGNLRSWDRDGLMEQRRVLAQSHLYIDDTPNLTLTRMKAKARRIKERKGGLDLILIDQLNHFDWEDFWQRGMQDNAAYGHLAKGCKTMGQELGVPVGLLCQLNRESAKRTDPTPKLADLAESGKLEQHADVISFVHRPEYYDKGDESLTGKGQIIVSKNREGDTGVLECLYLAPYLLWKDETEPTPEQGRFYE